MWDHVPTRNDLRIVSFICYCLEVWVIVLFYRDQLIYLFIPFVEAKCIGQLQRRFLQDKLQRSGIASILTGSRASIKDAPKIVRSSKRYHTPQKSPNMDGMMNQQTRDLLWIARKAARGMEDIQATALGYASGEWSR